MTVTYSTISECKTIRINPDFSPDPMRKCIIPFIYNERRYDGCISVDNNGSYWCATEVSADGSIGRHSSKWGICGKNCPKDGKHIFNLNDK